MGVGLFYVGWFGRWVMPEETANLRQSRNANRSPIHPRLAPLKSRGAGGLLFEGDFFLSLCCVGEFGRWVLLKKEPRIQR